MEHTLRTATPRTTWNIPNVWGLGGATAGLVAGVIMVIVTPLATWLANIGAWTTATTSTSASLTGTTVASMLGGAATVVAVAVVLGAIFGIMYGRVLRLTTDFGLAVYVALVYGIATFALDYTVIQPAISSIVPLMNVGMGTVLAQHLVFAVCLGVCYTVIRPTPYQDMADMWAA